MGVTVVALRKESVDRNFHISYALCFLCSSLSARRAWIEMVGRSQGRGQPESLSARRAWIEIDDMSGATGLILSLSARRAWIEISVRRRCYHGCYVALRKESVDRNTSHFMPRIGTFRSLSARRAWIEIMIQHKKEKSTRQSLSARRAWIEISTG